MKVLNYVKDNGEVKVTVKIQEDLLDVCVSEQQFSKWEKINKQERNKNIEEQEEEAFLDLVDANDGDFYIARLKWPIVKNIEKNGNDFITQVQQHFLNN